jgi:hypothetical protein
VRRLLPTYYRVGFQIDARPENTAAAAQKNSCAVLHLTTQDPGCRICKIQIELSTTEYMVTGVRRWLSAEKTVESTAKHSFQAGGRTSAVITDLLS